MKEKKTNSSVATDWRCWVAGNIGMASIVALCCECEDLGLLMATKATGAALAVLTYYLWKRLGVSELFNE